MIVISATEQFTPNQLGRPIDLYDKDGTHAVMVVLRPATHEDWLNDGCDMDFQDRRTLPERKYYYWASMD